MFFRPDVCEGFRHTISPLLWRKHEDGDPGVSSGVISRSMQRLAVELLDRAIMMEDCRLGLHIGHGVAGRLDFWPDVSYEEG